MESAPQYSAPLKAVSEPIDPSHINWYKGFRRPVAEILADLSKVIPSRYLAERKQGGIMITYLPWHTCCKLLDRVAPGWDYNVVSLHTTNDRIFVTARLIIRASEGDFCREAIGTEQLKEEFFDKETKNTKIREIAYGDCSSNAEAMALRRCAAKFGLARYLYERD